MTKREYSLKVKVIFMANTESSGRYHGVSADRFQRAEHGRIFGKETPFYWKISQWPTAKFVDMMVILSWDTIYNKNVVFNVRTNEIRFNSFDNVLIVVNDMRLLFYFW